MKVINRLDCSQLNANYSVKRNTDI